MGGDEVVIGDGLEEVVVVESSGLEIKVKILVEGYSWCSGACLNERGWYIDSRWGRNTIAPFLCRRMEIVHDGARGEVA